MGLFVVLFLERLEEAMETSVNMPLVNIIREYSKLSAKQAMEEREMGRDRAADGGGGCSTDCVEVSRSEDAAVRVFITELRGLIRKGRWVYLGSYSKAEATVCTHDAVVMLVLRKRAKPNFP
ncbi:hypothetical protein GUJ93_ZPchr0012g21685 [Zizania palustris]|uniref:Uncharacterized protein n=1 Tax=Zizania palustris TaxID=103762 RepID=A0A8J6BZ32_ZIZPA|nr:hypothetical protein GUJ93_ZPchr0012g21685 [Zizania palustris]